MKKGVLPLQFFGLCFSVLFVSARAGIESGEPPLPAQIVMAPVVTPTPSGPPKKIHELGQTFVLSDSARSDNVDTEEYLLEGETAADWTQMLTYQKQIFASPVAADRFVGGLKSQFEASADGPRFRLVQQRPDASIFAVQYQGNGKAPAQVVLAFATVPSAARPKELHVVQFIMNSERLPIAQMELLMKRWQSHFRAQSDALAP